MCSEPKKATFLSATEHWVIKQVQTEVYFKEIDCIKRKSSLPKDGQIRDLHPVLDEDGLLRVGGRLNRSGLTVEGKNPIIIPGKHHVATLLIRRHHELVRHQGRLFTEGAVRAAGLWITGCKRLVSSLCHKCVKCRKLRAKTSHQLMADLPEDRLTPAPPFTFVGVDTFGHWTIVFRRTRGGIANAKRWAIVFSCLVTRAIHIEIVEDMTSSAFINALRRFVSLTGKVKHFRSDRGTNFIGSIKDLQINAINLEDIVESFLNSQGAEWIFNPPHSSHMGGSWERMIGIIRRILNAMLSDVAAKNLTHDVLTTFMAEVCAIVNARPLVPVSSDPEYPFILTPNILLTQKTDQVCESFESSSDRDQRDIYRAEWKRVQLLADTFWKRWEREYIRTLQTRRKWKDSQPNIKQDDVVLLKDRTVSRNDWPVGIVVNTLPGTDNKVRKAAVRVVKGDKAVV